ncbi:hypothetical protein [Methanoregula sp.]|uniref:hypothetical protein n=1 Tax=Methanoregula sp. TaxID=2052170 RepID=UPI003BB0561A
MTESVITEFTGSQRDSISRVYRYGVGGIQVQDSHDVTRRLYRFDPSSNTMTENDPAQPGKILRRFVFDNYGMLEEAFSFGQPPRTFRYEAGGRQIVMREGGDYGAVGKTFSFEENGIAETAFGRDGSVERAYVFEPGGGAITIRSGGWYGDIERRLVCERINASVFREPEAFLQFLMFTEKSQREIDAEIDEQVAKIRGGSAPAPGQSRFAYTGPRHTSDDGGRPGGTAAPRPPDRSAPRPDNCPAGSPARRPEMRAGGSPDSGIDFIPDGDSSPQNASRGNPAARERSNGIPFEERWQSATNDREELSVGRSARIPLEERFQSAHDERGELTQGRSARIPLEERFQDAEGDKDELTPGRSTQISYEERKTGRKLQ